VAIAEVPTKGDPNTRCLNQFGLGAIAGIKSKRMNGALTDFEALGWYEPGILHMRVNNCDDLSKKRCQAKCASSSAKR
jgi:hypothetical protein